MTIQATLCLIIKDNRVLLLNKSRGLFGQGKWNAPGGKIVSNEEPKECAVREVFEGTRLTVKSVEQIGFLYFYKDGQGMNPNWAVHAFLTLQFEGVPIAGPEGRLEWFSIDALPFQEMWEEDQYWYRLVLDGTRFEGWFYFSGDFEKLIDYRIEVKSLPSQIEV